MKIKRNDKAITIKMPTELKEAAEKILAEQGHSMSSFIREKLEEVIKGGK